VTGNTSPDLTADAVMIVTVERTADAVLSVMVKKDNNKSQKNGISL